MRPRLLLGTSLNNENIKEPDYYWVRVAVYVSPDTVSIIQKVKRTLYRWFHPLYGGVDGKGWRLGQRLREDMLWRQIGETPGVEAIRGITVDYWNDTKRTWTSLTVDKDRPITVPPDDIKEFERIIADVNHLVNPRGQDHGR
jgi:hypothetical protein